MPPGQTGAKALMFLFTFLYLSFLTFHKITVMPKYFFLSFFIFLVQAATSQLLIKNTNVIDVENNKILTGYDVLVKNGRITFVVKTTAASSY